MFTFGDNKCVHTSRQPGNQCIAICPNRDHLSQKMLLPKGAKQTCLEEAPTWGPSLGMSDGRHVRKWETCKPLVQEKDSPLCSASLCCSMRSNDATTTAAFQNKPLCHSPLRSTGLRWGERGKVREEEGRKARRPEPEGCGRMDHYINFKAFFS